MRPNPLRALPGLGQSVWMDYFRRNLLTSGELAGAIEEDDLRGVTSNPTIFEKAIAGSHDYDKQIRALALGGKGVEEILQELMVEDIRRAADVFRPAFDRLGGSDGFVSLEVSPHLAHDTRGTIAEARKLWAALDRPNVMIKVPATVEGLPAITALTAEGINVNITLLFGLPRYRQVAEAYLAGLEARVSRKQPVHTIASVASFFLSRIDVLLDPRLERVPELASLRGEVAIASAKVAYQMYKGIFASERFRRLADQGARPQRLLWASTGTKDPAYSDLKYVEPLIGPDTINTMPVETMNAYRDHGNPAPRLEEGVDEARRVLERLAQGGVALDEATHELEDEGVAKFIKPFDQLVKTLAAHREAARREAVDRQSVALGEYYGPVTARLGALAQQEVVSRIWRRDPALFGSTSGLGFLHAPERMEPHVAGLRQFAAEVHAAGFRHAVLLGMGGSSLAARVFARTFPASRSALKLSVLDSVDPLAVAALERSLVLRETLFVVASKSGTTTETSALCDTFFERLRAETGADPGAQFVAITDPGTPLEQLARQRHFRRTFLGFADVGGRYSALTHYGLLPAALMGVDVGELVVRAMRMSSACASCAPLQENPGALLGAVLDELGARGRDKVTLLLPPPIAELGTWIEQLVAESTGKDGRGLLPVVAEPPARELGVYGPDRLFVHLRLRGEPDRDLEEKAATLRGRFPVLTLDLEDRLDVAQEFFRWELATLIASLGLEVDPFDEPNVQEGKDNTNAVLARMGEGGELPEEGPGVSEGPLRLYVEGRAKSAAEVLRALLGGAQPRGYLALLAFLPELPAVDEALQGLRLTLRDRLAVATTVGYGPRYLHSTGQYHKGGPANGVYLQLTAAETERIAIPGRPYTLGTLERAQALGDFEALRRRRRPVLRVNLGDDPVGGLVALRKLVDAALPAKR